MQFHTPILSAVEKAAQEGLKEAGKALLKRARELSPTDDGTSDKSGFSRVDDLTLQVGFTSLVSRLQHEKLDYKHDDGGQAKFLENAAFEVDVGGIVAAKMRGALDG